MKAFLSLIILFLLNFFPVLTMAINPPSPTTARAGKVVYETYCIVCHDSGMAGSPKFRDKIDWQLRIQQGLPTLIAHAMQGYHIMPPKGTCSTCSEDEISNAVKYMVD